MDKKIKFVGARIEQKLATRFKIFLLKTNQTLEDWLTKKIKEELKK